MVDLLTWDVASDPEGQNLLMLMRETRPKARRERERERECVCNLLFENHTTIRPIYLICTTYVQIETFFFFSSQIVEIYTHFQTGGLSFEV